ncbi:MAG: NTP transferase domain-containing protein [Chloroflexi bacterium]|nr:NTP transferase domain-containing protein [Chloroflexota bacterium]
MPEHATRGGSLQGVILAAGKGSRLHPITTTRSKAMLPVLGQPIVERVMESLHAHGGVREFILVVSENDHDIRRHFAEESTLDGDIQFVVQRERLGMANALACAAPAIHSDFILSACDNLVADQHVAALVATWWAQPDLDGLLSVMRIGADLLGRTGIVELVNGRVTRIIEKPPPEEAPTNIASLPLYIFTPRLLEYVHRVQPSARGEYELQDAIQMLIEDGGEVTSLPTAGRLTLTGPDDLLAINRHYLVTGHGRPQLAPFTVGPNTQLITPLRIEEGTVIGEGCLIGPHVYIERDCRIGSHVTIQDAVVLRGAVLEDGTKVVGEVIS